MTVLKWLIKCYTNQNCGIEVLISLHMPDENSLFEKGFIGDACMNI